MKGTVFKNSKLEEVDFTECDLNNAIFENSDLVGATFDKTILEKSDFRTSFNFSIDPSANKIRKAKFSMSGIPGLLHGFDIEIDRNA